MSFAIPARIDRFELPHPEGGHNFTISVWRPEKSHPDRQDVPVLFLLDADAEFCLAAEIARLHGVGGFHPTAMVVGIGYDVDYFELARVRTADYTFPIDEAGKAALGNLAQFTGTDTGGAAALLDFLIDTLSLEISRRYPDASATDRALFGHSLGGLFAAYALLNRPDAFAAFLPASPSLWWNDFAILSHLPVFAEKLKTLDRQPRVLVSVGGKEQDLPTRTMPGVDMSVTELQTLAVMARMVDAAAEFADALRRIGLSDVSHIVFDEENHGTVLPAAIQRGLSFIAPHIS